MKILYGLLWALSSLFFIAYLFYTYGNLQPEVQIQVGSIDWSMNKSLFFYSWIVLFIVFTIPIFVLQIVIDKLPAQMLKMPKKTFWISENSTIKVMKDIFKSTTLALAMICNLIFLIPINIIGAYNHQDGKLSYQNNFIIYAIIIATILAIISYLRFYIPKEDLLRNY